MKNKNLKESYFVVVGSKRRLKINSLDKLSRVKNEINDLSKKKETYENKLIQLKN